MNYFSLAGMVINIIASIILAFSISKVLSIFNSSLSALETFNETIISTKDIVLFTGLDEHRKNLLKRSKRLTTFGILILLLGFILQLIGLLIG